MGEETGLGSYKARQDIIKNDAAENSAKMFGRAWDMMEEQVRKTRERVSKGFDRAKTLALMSSACRLDMLLESVADGPGELQATSAESSSVEEKVRALVAEWEAAWKTRAEVDDGDLLREPAIDGQDKAVDEDTDSETEIGDDDVLMAPAEEDETADDVQMAG